MRTWFAFVSEFGSVQQLGTEWVRLRLMRFTPQPAWRTSAEWQWNNSCGQVHGRSRAVLFGVLSSSLRGAFRGVNEGAEQSASESHPACY